MRRWTLVALGVLCVGIGGVGVIVPGLPTTIFLIGASWCFTRSCPWLEERLIRNRVFGPYLAYLEPGARMPKKVMWATLAVMWCAICTSTILLAMNDAAIALLIGIPFSGLIGTGFIVRAAKPATKNTPTDESIEVPPETSCPFIASRPAAAETTR